MCAIVVLGIILIIIGLLVGGLHILFTIGVIVAVIGLVLLLIGSTGHPVGGRNHWF